LARRISSTFLDHPFFTLIWRKPFPASGEQSVGTPAVTQDRCITSNIFACGCAKRAAQHESKVTGSAHRHGVNGPFTVANKPSL
jgi:hypothetical protein